MAIPSITNNSPSAGRIAWGAFNIQLNGVTYSVGAGSTDQRWVWWKYNNGTPSINAGPEVPLTLVDDDLVLFANKNGIGVRVQSTNFVDGELLVDGSIFADALSTNLINSEHIVTAGLDAGVIKFGTMSGDRIGVNTLLGNRILANSVVASKLAITDFNNYVADPMFDTALVSMPRLISTVPDQVNKIYVRPVTDAVVPKTDLPNVAYVGDLGPGGYNFFATDEGSGFPIEPGDEFYVDAYVAHTGAGTSGLALLVWCSSTNSATNGLDQGGWSYPGLNVTAASAQDKWIRVQGTIVIPALNTAGSGTRKPPRYGFAALNPGNQDGWWIADWNLYRKGAGKLIVDGSIIGDHIKGETITGTKLAGETITGDKIQADTIAVSKLIVSDLTNYAVDGYFDDPTMANWDLGTPAHLVRVDPAGAVPYGEVTTATNRSSYFRNKHLFETETGAEYFISLEVQTPSTNVDTLRFNPGLEVYDVDGVSQLWRTAEYVDVVPNTDWTLLEAVIRITDTNLARARFNSYVNASTTANQKLRIRKVQLRRRGNGKLIVDGSITGREIDANTINADHIDLGTLTGDLFVGELIMGSTIRTANLDDDGNVIGAYAEMGPDGILTVDSSGNPIAQFPLEAANGAYVKAHMDLLSAEVRDNFRMHGTNNSIATEGELTLDAGVSPPTAPPTLTEFWDTLQLDKTSVSAPHAANTGYNLGTIALNPSQITSIDWDSEWGCWAVCQQRSNGFRIWRFTSAGAFYKNMGTGRNWHDDYNDRQNASICYNSVRKGISHLSQSGADWYIWGRTAGGADVTNKIPASWILDADSRPPKLSFDGAANQYVLIQNNGGGAGTIHVRRFTLNTGSGFPNATSQSTTNFEAGSGMARRINGAVVGSQLTGSGTNWAVTVDEYGAYFAYTNAGVQLDDNGSYHQWGLAAPCLGSCWTGSQFASVDATGKISFYENWNTTVHPTYMYFGASAFDSDAAGNTANPHAGQTAGQHETPVGTIVRLSPKRRSKIRITMPETNDGGGADDPDQWKVYFTRSSNPATPTDKNVFRHTVTMGSPTAPTSTVITSDPNGAVPPGGLMGQAGSVNNFPAADPARIESAALDSSGQPVIALRGDGAGRLGPFAWDAAGNTTADPRKVGEVIQFYGTKAQIPAGFLAMDGTTFSSATYPKLAAHLGTTTLPNMSGRVPRGPASGQVGKEVGGSDTVTMPDHTHPVPNHQHNVGNITLSKVSRGSGTATPQVMSDISGTTGPQSSSFSTGNVDGTNPPIGNVPSYMAMWFCIKAV